MFVDDSINGLRAQIRSWRDAGHTIALVPTMGNLHEGHYSLIKTAHAYADKVVVSIFVNPLQFDDQHDLAAYPRTLEDDIQKLSDTTNCDLVFAPTTDLIYPNGMQQHTRVHVPNMDDKLCGLHRPGHFDGVATIVTKLFCIVQPEVAVFGEKDYQQLLLIQKIVADLNLPIKIIGSATLREKSGLAMSSRNQRLTESEQQKAPLLYQQLQSIKQQFDQDKSTIQISLEQAKLLLTEAGFVVEYLTMLSAETLQSVEPSVNHPLRIFAAVQLGKVRLIDNIAVSLPDKT